MTKVSTVDGISVRQCATDDYSIHQFKDYVTADNCKLEWTGASTLAPSSATVYLEIYNRNTSSWDVVASNSSAGAGVSFTLVGYIRGMSSYKDVNNVVSCRVYQSGA